jgi:hypothetical protein
MSLRTYYTSRVNIPKMVLSDATNPLTEPHPPLPNTLTAAERAAARFATHGNAISEQSAPPLNFAAPQVRGLMDSRPAYVVDGGMMLLYCRHNIQLLGDLVTLLSHLHVHC